MHLHLTTHVDAPPAALWLVVTDVERWPEWTASMSSVQRLDVGYFGAGTRVRIRQPRLPEVIWRVTSFQAGSEFTWEATRPGLHSLATHRVEPDGAGSKLTLIFDQDGWVGTLLGYFIAKKARGYVQLELDGLKKAAEEAGQSA